jgi:hypothetical protein
MLSYTHCYNFHTKDKIIHIDLDLIDDFYNYQFNNYVEKIILFRSK